MWRLLACTTQEPAPPPKLQLEHFEIGRAHVVAVGDVMMHGGVKAAAESADHRLGGRSINAGGYRELFRELEPAISAADLAFANIEFPVAPTTAKGTRSMVFDAPPVVLDALGDVGFDVVSFANNHVYDQGRAGFMETLDHIDATPLRRIGAGFTCDEAYAPKIVASNGISIAWLGATQVQNDWLNEGEDVACVAEIDVDRILRSVALAREEGADLVIFSAHWGVEYETSPRRLLQHAIAHDLVEGGVDVLLGHHPHSLQPIEWITTRDGRRTLVAYSLGNFISNQAADFDARRHPIEEGNPRDGVLLGFDVIKHREVRDGEIIVSTRIEGLSLEPLWTRNDSRAEPPISVAPSKEREAHVLSILQAPIPWPEPSAEQQLSRR